MKIDLAAINREDFFVDENIVGGEKVYLVHPRPSYFDWTPETLHFRSSVWNAEGEPVSLGFKKFFNFEEKPAIAPFTEPFEAVEKLDGSLLIVSRYKGETIYRTRGKLHALQHHNGHEIELFKSCYGAFLYHFESCESRSESFLFEWMSPLQKIVINYGPKPDFKLIGVVYHYDYSLYSQTRLNSMALAFGFDRPETRKYASVPAMLGDIEKEIGVEGVCVYYNDGQDIRKVKTPHYLKLHAFKSQLTPRAIGSQLFDWCPLSWDDFVSTVEKTFDYECRVACEPVAKPLYDLYEKLNRELETLRGWTVTQLDRPQKDFALEVKSKWPAHLHQYAFKVKAGKTYGEESLKKTYMNLVDEAA